MPNVNTLGNQLQQPNKTRLVWSDRGSTTATISVVADKQSEVLRQAMHHTQHREALVPFVQLLCTDCLQVYTTNRLLSLTLLSHRHHLVRGHTNKTRGSNSSEVDEHHISIIPYRTAWTGSCDQSSDRATDAYHTNNS